MTKKPVVAAFDFDGTITYRDTLLSFLIFTFGATKTYFKLMLELPWIIGFLAGVIKREDAKEHVLTRFFKGKNRLTLQKFGNTFAHNALHRHLRPQSLQRLHWHKKQGHRCILISASIDLYIEPWAKMMGFETALCTRLAYDVNKNATGRIKGNNCWGPEKVERLTAYLGPRDAYTLYAYGDSRGDKELLEFADHPYYRTME